MAHPHVLTQRTPRMSGARAKPVLGAILVGAPIATIIIAVAVVLLT